ncbi:UNVERIFIED_ORG: hypothetical protein HNP28_003745 [Comamonas terrigena]
MTVETVLLIGWRAFVIYQFNHMVQGIATNSQAASQRILQQEKDRQAVLARQREEKAQRDAQAFYSQQLAQREANERATRKETAWNLYFKSTQKCRDDPVTVECANVHIRAENNFEETYRDPL